MEQNEMKQRFQEALPQVDFASLRVHWDKDENYAVRRDVLEPVSISPERGAMAIVHHGGGMGYGATTDLSVAGLKKAFEAAKRWAEVSAKFAVVDFAKIQMPHPKGEFRSPVKKTFGSRSAKEHIDALMGVSKSIKINDSIVDWEVGLWHARSERMYFTNEGGEVYQDFDRLVPNIRVTAHKEGVTQTRTFGNLAKARQQGLEVLEDFAFFGDVGRTLAEEATELLSAPNCPEGACDLLLDPEQMVLQIHESIGHPLELDRILGDERNYAGTSFVTRDMFGSYQYGSSLLNVTFDPTMAHQTASYGYDDEGHEAAKEFIIRDGILERPLGGTIAQNRADMAGTANSRADSWKRPPIDRMANLNVEPGTSSFEDMVAGVEKGVYMRTNTSWSIDDSRNKFQFGCEWAQLIENGELTTVVRNPNYRGISAEFWRGLSKVGDRSTFEVYGTPYCGKGEPNQSVFVGHASPTCLFSNVEVFGGE